MLAFCGLTFILCAADFFVPEGVPNPVWGAFCRTCTYSLGSICFGSVILAVVQFVRVIANSLKYASGVEEAVGGGGGSGRGGRRTFCNSLH